MKKNLLKIIILISIVLVIFLCIIVKVLEKNNDPQITDEQLALDSENIEIETFKETEDSVLKEKLSSMTERERMEFYFGQFISLIESKKYEDAYNLLYDDFKDNYFPELNDFEIFVKNKFPRMLSVEHTNIERSGEIYILFVTIDNALSKGSEDSIEMKFIIKETALNEFVMSFNAE